jgi:hypothetical protein
MSNKQTAVDKLHNEMYKIIEFYAGNEQLDKCMELLDKAKEMQKEQMIEFALAVLMEAYATVEGNVTTELTIQEYYNLKYGGNK